MTIDWHFVLTFVRVNWELFAIILPVSVLCGLAFPCPTWLELPTTRRLRRERPM